MNPGVDLAQAGKGMLERLVGRYLPALNQALVEWDWVAGLAHRPVMLADCQLWEGLDIARHVLQSKLDLQPYPALTGFLAQCPGAATFEAMLREQPCPITGRPSEADALPRIQAALHAG
jgi:hypothetical protein